ncbi:SCO0930 family lipoprotein [Actinophytocola oryzae]|uniref:Putative lipoprotein with Yx(FWY)xxD motif n=1 Tax=Actinophytocola oryzae TaxID=502181 RepID=A0A4V6Q6X2_9PSEU|nr:SCO0930 family lipoprotein [Actinophytocola oryzae]TDV54041.1 putative lipoprotein with Yx(FWY)xxD motif [Actinophytocola oryzae]
MSRKRLVVPVFAGLALLTGCGAAPGPPTLIEPAAAPAGQAQQASVSLNTAGVAGLGTVLTDQDGRTLYLFTNDSKNPPTSTCVDACATKWPPLLGSDVLSAGVDRDLLGTVTRPDGTTQVTVGGWPVYTYSGDTTRGEATGQGLQDAWYAVTPLGTKAGAPAKPTAVVSTDIPGFGNALTDQDGRTLYLFTKDDKAPSQSRCDGQCAVDWPPLLTTTEVAVRGVDPALVGTVLRPDGSKQVTVGGWPVYSFAKDEKPGQTNGHGFGGVWFVVEKEGCKSTAPVPSSPESPPSADTGY